MAMDGCTILVVLGAIVAEDAVPYDSSIVENRSATIAVTIRSSLIDAVLHDESVEDCRDGGVEVAVVPPPTWMAPPLPEEVLPSKRLFSMLTCPR